MQINTKNNQSQAVQEEGEFEILSSGETTPINEDQNATTPQLCDEDNGPDTIGELAVIGPAQTQADLPDLVSVYPISFTHLHNNHSNSPPAVEATRRLSLSSSDEEAVGDDLQPQKQGRHGRHHSRHHGRGPHHRGPRHQGPHHYGPFDDFRLSYHDMERGRFPFPPPPGFDHHGLPPPPPGHHHHHGHGGRHGPLPPPPPPGKGHRTGERREHGPPPPHSWEECDSHFFGSPPFGGRGGMMGGMRGATRGGMRGGMGSGMRGGMRGGKDRHCRAFSPPSWEEYKCGSDSDGVDRQFGRHRHHGHGPHHRHGHRRPHEKPDGKTKEHECTPLESEQDAGQINNEKEGTASSIESETDSESNCNVPPHHGHHKGPRPGHGSMRGMRGGGGMRGRGGPPGRGPPHMGPHAHMHGPPPHSFGPPPFGSPHYGRGGHHSGQFASEGNPLPPPFRGHRGPPRGYEFGEYADDDYLNFGPPPFHDFGRHGDHGPMRGHGVRGVHSRGGFGHMGFACPA
ncbi:uncharacterized protein IL334_007135 [Kwoniella shivajii]|uniref:Uncharacterized protein n=1 Tax=Kwoniella shivajii TaxID=564305 RepID=A0ABZ1D8L8_9TREE|nr:hypothetical protein IL334_007135 [Kwoniella shivajii]